MMKHSLINRDFKIKTVTQRINHHRFRVPAILAGTVVLLIAVFYFKSATSTIESGASNDKPLPKHIVSIDLPADSSTGFTNPVLEKLLTTPSNSQHASVASVAKTSGKAYTVKSGDSLAKIFARLSYSPSTLHNIIQLDDRTKLLKRIKPGQVLRFTQNSNGECEGIEYDIDRVKTLSIRLTDNGFKSVINEKPVEISHATASAEINNSLFQDAKQAGLSDRTIMELANIFGWDIDFSQGLRQGDTFTLLYESKYIAGKRIENGHILAAEFVNRGNKLQAVRFTDKTGHAEYFSPDGKSMRKTFLRNPIDFARVSSRFNLRRKHPVLNRIRAHKGVDYAASTGTPIKSTGDGKVVFRGVKGGYGRAVIIQHGQKYSTLYAHMSKYGRYKKGSRIKQGQTVGYVGSSGLATGPHLHYELRINGVHRNPLTAKFPAAKPIDKKLLAKFKQQTTPLLAQLELARQTQLALN